LLVYITSLPVSSSRSLLTDCTLFTADFHTGIRGSWYWEDLKPTPDVLVQVIRINQDSYKHVR
jgi:hypothetical protein